MTRLVNRIVSLHGKNSNALTSSLQLELLGIKTSEILNVEGPFTSEKRGLHISESLGTDFYSWFLDYDNYGNEESVEATKVLCQIVNTIFHATRHLDRFDLIYGFSQGAAVVHLINTLPINHALVCVLEESGVAIPWEKFAGKTAFRAAIFACAAGQHQLDALLKAACLPKQPPVARLFQSLHLVGLKDPFRKESEEFIRPYRNGVEKIAYLPGVHEIAFGNGGPRKYVELLYEFISNLSAAAPLYEEVQLSFSDTDEISRGISQYFQRVFVTAEFDNYPKTIQAVLDVTNPDCAFLRNARETRSDLFTSYGQFLEFIKPGGLCDLQRIGVRQGERVGYVIPSNGSALSAAASLAIAAQTCAVPLSSALNVADATSALSRLKISHIIIFQGINCPGMCKALENFSSIHVHHAFSSTMHTPGLFQFIEYSDVSSTDQLLRNRPDDIAVLLQTSGTTSTPKIVPLTQQALLLNAQVLAKGMGLTNEDITYSVMPLDHIGGISASLLSSFVVGATLTCETAFSPEKARAALTVSCPRPMWFSAVPSLHNAIVNHIISKDCEDEFKASHSLRMLRSGAALLKDDDKKRIEHLFGCPLVSTYSMSEIMPITQPLFSNNVWRQTNGSVGIPMIASLSVVDTETLMPLEYGKIGEICVSGDTVFKGYINNPDANAETRFLQNTTDGQGEQVWFRTGDLGALDQDGNLFLHGRKKEIIKRAGEQISPYEIEDALVTEDVVSTAVCFPVPCDRYGEQVGCAVVLTQSAHQFSERQLVKKLRQTLKEKKIAAHKIPSVWGAVDEVEIPKTSTGKYIRNQCADVLFFEERQQATQEHEAGQTSQLIDKKYNKPFVAYSSIAGFRFLLACYVMFMHFGAAESFQIFSNLRQFPWHVHAFFVVSGFSIAIGMPKPITEKRKFVFARISAFYPLYVLAVVLCFLNLIWACNLSNFNPEFQWISGFSQTGQCYGTPLLQEGWGWNVVSTLVIHLAGLQASPLWMGF